MMEPTDLYRKRLIVAYKSLIDFHGELFNQIVNIGMTGEYNDIDKYFEIGESYNFDIEQFKNANDINLVKLTQFHEKLVELIESLANMNSIKKSELEQGAD